jgi:hypothetical protein
MFVLFKIFLAASGPAGGHFHRRSGAGTIHGKLGTFVKRHDDVGAESDLSFHRALGAEEMRRAIQVRPKGHTFLVDLAQLVQTENLKSAGVSEDRPAPSHEPMQPAQLSHGLDARPQIEVIGIAKNHVCAQFLQCVLRHAFHRSQRSHRHEYRRLDCGMRREEAPAARLAGGLVAVEFDGHCLGL